jgi:hypothetical protein
MDRDEVRALLERVSAGTATTDEALSTLVRGPLGGGAGTGAEDLGFARLDTHRALRTGDPEVVYGAGKTPDQNVALLRALREQPGHRSALATRLTDEALRAIGEAFPDARIDPVARCAALGEPADSGGRVLVVSAGTSDEPVAREAAFVAAEFGCATGQVRDVGVAGIHRVIAVRDELDAADCLIVVAGLVGVPVVAVPTSVGYGSALGGIAPLLTMLNSCGPGVLVCNIDNGFGAAVAAARMTRRMVRARVAEPGPVSA